MAGPLNGNVTPDADADHVRLTRELDLANKRADLAHKKASTKGTWAASAAALGGLFVLLAGFFGIKFNSASDELNSAQGTVSTQDSVITEQAQSIATLQKDKADLQGVINGLGAENTDLKNQVSSLSSQLAAATGAPAGAAPTSAQARPAAGTVYHQGNITLVEDGDGISLFAPPSDPKWGAKNYDLGSIEDGHVLYISDDLAMWFVDLAKAPTGSIADFATCSGLTTYTSGASISIPVTELSDVPVHCLRLSNGQYATVRLVGQEGNAVTLEITVWRV